MIPLSRHMVVLASIAAVNLPAESKQGRSNGDARTSRTRVYEPDRSSLCLEKIQARKRRLDNARRNFQTGHWQHRVLDAVPA